MAKTSFKKKDIDIIQKKLLKEKETLEKELAKFAKKDLKKGSYKAKFQDIGDDESDNVSEVAQYSLDISLKQTLEKALRDVDKTMETLKKACFGLCKYCKQPIDIKRLKARPSSSACVACKTKLKSL